MPKFSVVFASPDPASDKSLWLREQESEQVEVIIAQLDPEVDCAYVLNQALEAAQGDYVALVDETLQVGIPHWLELLQAHIDSGPYQMLGLSGYEEIIQQDNMAQTAAKVVTPVASASGNGVTTYSASRFFGNAHIKEVVIIDGRCLFARRSLFRHFPMQPGQGTSLTRTLFQHQIRLALELGQAQGVLLGVNHEISEDSSWRDQTALNECWDQRYQHLLPLDCLQLSMWRLNLHGLHHFDPQAADQLLYLMSRDHGARFQYRDHNRVSAVKGDHIALIVDHFNEVETLPDGDTFIVLGAGTGLLIQQLLGQPGNEVMVVEPEYGLVCELLKYYDWSDSLSEGRLRFMPLPKGTHEINEITANQTTRLLQMVLDKTHRSSSVIRGYSYHLNTPWFRRIEQGLLQFMHQKDAVKTWIGQRRRVYDVTVISPKCAIFTNLAQCFNDLGLRTRLFNVPDKFDQLSVDQIQSLLMQLAADGSRLTLCRNRSFFETENVRKAASLERYVQGKLVNWWWDVPNVASFIDFNDPLVDSENICFAVDMLNLLPKGSHWLPPGAGTGFCRERQPDTPWLFDVSFVGQSRIPQMFGHLQAILQFINLQCGSVPDGLAHRLLKPANFRGLHGDICQLEEEFHGVLYNLSQVAPAQVYFYRYIFAMAKTAAFRVAAVETLIADGVPVNVFGDHSWRSFGVVPDQHFHGPAAPEDLAAIYQGSRLNLNLNFMQVSSTINPKVLDIMACDGAVLTDYRPEVEVLFPDADAGPLTFTDLDQLVPLVKKTLGINNLDSWRQNGQLVRSGHTLLHRARWLADAYLS
ncbi:MAG: glycosyltransferase [Ketobacteraceae bacterium]|nr:glycosyltransferase [Ketobacteraceae bacterium]